MAAFGAFFIFRNGRRKLQASGQLLYVPTILTFYLTDAFAFGLSDQADFAACGP
jgi:hypothetical protein